MHLRTSFVAAAILTAGLTGLSGLSSSAYASTGSVTGIFKSGNATFAGSTYGCTTGSVGGTYDTGNNPALVFSTASVSCNTALGAVTISLNSCTIPVTLGSRALPIIPGTTAFGTGTCVKVSALGGLCTANVHGTVNVSYDEATKTVGGVNYNDLIFSGSGTLANQSGGCFGLYTGSFTLNNFNFNFTPPINFV